MYQKHKLKTGTQHSFGTLCFPLKSLLLIPCNSREEKRTNKTRAKMRSDKRGVITVCTISVPLRSMCLVF
uniref:Uncharacterized protein n=1 Tax=Haplochromis burtoni TaxID=8153 RepID=A0A3Q3CGH2_HAPBU